MKKGIIYGLLFLSLFFFTSCISESKRIQKRLDEVKAALDASFGENGLYKVIEKDVVLPTELKKVKLTWLSKEENIITSAGKVTRQKIDTPVSFDVKLDYQKESITLTYQITVKGNPNLNMIRFDSKGGNRVSPILEEYQRHIIKPTDPTRDGYIFAGWYLEEEYHNQYIFYTMPDNDIVLFAKWDENMEYRLKEDDTYEIVKYKGNEREVIILEYYQGKKVTSIGKDAFRGSNDLEKITFSNQITSIGEYAFAYCEKLRYVYIPSNISKLGRYAFYSFQDIIVYSEASSQPVEWDYSWNRSTLTSYWGISDIAEKDGFQYIHLNEGIQITRYIGKESTVEIPSTIAGKPVTVIGTAAFQKCDSLLKVVVPKSVNRIEGSAFHGCSDVIIYCESSEQLISVSYGWKENRTPVYWNFLKNNVKNGLQYIIVNQNITITQYLGKETEVKIPSEINGYAVTKIGENAFSNIEYLRSVIIPSTVKEIEDNAFSKCYNLTIYCEEVSQPTEWSRYWMSESIPVYWGISNYKQNKDFQYVITDYQVTITRYIGKENHVIIPSSMNGYPVIKIGEAAFAYAFHVENITFPNTLEVIETAAFLECINLKMIVFPKGLRSIKRNAFRGCNQVTSIYIPNTVLSMDEYVFSNPFGKAIIYCEAKEIPNTWSDDWAYSSYVHWGVDKVLEDKGIQYRILDGSIAILNYIGSEKELEIPSKINGYPVVAIEERAFSGSDSLLKIIISDGITMIGKHAFFGCSNLREVKLPSTITKIEEGTFRFCKDLQNIVIPNGVTTIARNAFQSCSNLKKVNLPTTLIKIEANAFHDCISLRSIWIPSSVMEVQSEAFNFHSDLVVYCETIARPSGWAPYWYSIIKSIYWGVNEVKENEIYQYIIVDYEVCITSYTGKESVLSIPSNIDGYPVTIIGNKVFSNNNTLINMWIPDSVTTIRSSAFSNCSNLASITLSNKLTKIEASTFFGCINLTSVTIPNSVISIGRSAFYDCNNLRTITLPNTVAIVEEDAFRSCDQLVVLCETTEKPNGWSPYWGDGVRVYWGAQGKFEYNDFQCVIINNNITIARYYGSEKNLVIPAVINGYLVTSIGDSAFSGNNKLTNITLPNTLKHIGNIAFQECSNLTDVIIPNGVTTIEDRVFAYCSRLTKVFIPKSVTDIGMNIFVLVNDVTIYCEVTSKPVGWDYSWNLYGKVVWDYKNTN